MRAPVSVVSQPHQVNHLLPVEEGKACICSINDIALYFEYSSYRGHVVQFDPRLQIGELCRNGLCLRVASQRQLANFGEKIINNSNPC